MFAGTRYHLRYEQLCERTGYCVVSWAWTFNAVMVTQTALLQVREGQRSGIAKLFSPEAGDVG